MSGERSGRRPSINGLQHGRLDLDEIFAIHELAQGAGDGGPHAENFAHLRIHRQVRIALAIAQLGIGQGGVTHHFTADLFILGRGQRRDSLRNHTEFFDAQANLASFGAEHFAGRLHKVANVVIIAELI